MDSGRRLLVMMRDPPYSGAGPRERLDLVLMALAFEQRVAVVFAGAGVLQLLAPGDQQDPLHDHAAALGSLSLYGIDGIYAEAEALRRFGIEVSQLRVAVTVVGASELADLMHGQDLLL